MYAEAQSHEYLLKRLRPEPGRGLSLFTSPTVTLSIIALPSVGWSTVRVPGIGHSEAFLGSRKGISELLNGPLGLSVIVGLRVTLGALLAFWASENSEVSLMDWFVAVAVTTSVVESE